MKKLLLAATVLTLAACAGETTAPSATATAITRNSDLVSAFSLVPCVFTTTGTTETLSANCVTDVTILVPNGMTLDGHGHSITGVDPAAGHFVGAVVLNANSVAYVKNLTVTVNGLADVCDDGAPRLRGIMFDGASGSIKNNKVIDLRQNGSGCQEGNSIEVRNPPFDGTHPATKFVEVANNTITGFMKTGIVVNGDVNGNVHNNVVGPSANQANLAANSIQFAFGAMGKVTSNKIAGNQWCGLEPVDDGTGLLLFSADGVNVSNNTFTDNADIGIYVSGLGNIVSNNKVFDDNSIPDCNASGDDFGIYNNGTSSSFTNNVVGGFTTPYTNVTGKGNKVRPTK